MLFESVTNWNKIEAELREQGFNRQKLLIIRELWYRLQPENLLKELSHAELEELLETVAWAYEMSEEN